MSGRRPRGKAGTQEPAEPGSKETAEPGSGKIVTSRPKKGGAAASKKVAAEKPAKSGKPERSGAGPLKTDDGRYVVVEGRRWRASNPNLPEDVRQRLVNELMDARRAVGRALRGGDRDAEAAARARVHAAKLALGERGPKWWEEGKDEG